MLLLIVPHEGTAITNCDLIESSHVYSDEGVENFHQFIFYDWDPRDCRHQVRAWRMVKANNKPVWRVAYDWDRQRWIASTDGFEVRAPLFRETWTQHDPEVAERDILPKEMRRELVGAGGINEH